MMTVWLLLLLVVSYSADCQASDADGVCRDGGLLGTLKGLLQSIVTKQQAMNEAQQQLRNELSSLTVQLQQLESSGPARERNVSAACTAAGFTYIASINGCYKVVNENLNWADAGDACQALHQNAHLLVIDDLPEQYAVTELIASIDAEDGSVMGGCNTHWWNGRWIWTAGQRVDPTKRTPFVWRIKSSGTYRMSAMGSYSKWAGGMPDYYQREACMVLVPRINYDWNDGPCENPYCYVCELEF